MIDSPSDNDAAAATEARDTIEQVLADAFGSAQVLRHEGHRLQADTLERFAERTSAALRSYLTVLSESEAMLRSGWGKVKLRGRFAEWEALGLALLDARGKRRYREIAVPARPATEQAKLAGMRGESLRSARHG